MLHPAHRLLLRNNHPDVKVLDVRDNVSDLTTYTFTAVSLGDIGASRTFNPTQLNDFPHHRIKSQKLVCIIVHSEAAAVTWTVSSCTIGGATGSKHNDRGGGTNAINTAMFFWTSEDLQNITNTDVVVTFSKAVTACAIGVLLIDNVYGLRSGGIATSSTTGTAAVNVLGSTTSLQNSSNGLASIAGSTCATGGGTELPQWDRYPGGGGGGGIAPIHLYEGSNAEIDFSAAWTYTPANGLDSGTAFWPGFRLDWSGTGAFDVVVCGIL